MANFPLLLVAVSVVWASSLAKGSQVAHGCKLDTCKNKKLEACNFDGCQDLEELNLEKRSLTGPLPNFQQKTMTKLKTIILAKNKLTGSVEALRTLVELKSISIGRNKFTGSVEALGKLVKLETLLIPHNDFSGSVEPLRTLTQLRELSLNSNQLTGSVESLGELTKLQSLRLDRNQFDGNVEALGSLTELKLLRVDGNKLSGSIAALGKLTKLLHLYLDGNQFTGSIDVLGKLTKLLHLSIKDNQFSGTLEALGLLHHITFLSIGKSGKFDPPVPENVFDLALADLHNLGFSCEWLDKDGLPSLHGTFVNYVRLGKTITLGCPDLRFPVLSNGSSEIVVISTGSSCAEAGFSVISTAAECEKAAKSRGGKHKVSQTDELPYCGVNEETDTYFFEVTGLKENAGNKKCNDADLSCVCKKAPSQLDISCELIDGKPQWKPNIDHYKCLGYGACSINDDTAEKLRSNSYADVTACSTRQDGDYCADFSCKDYRSLVHNPDRKKILCKYGVWQEVDKQYCVFCPRGQYKVSSTHCRECSQGKFLVSSQDNDQLECTNCPLGQYQNRTGQGQCESCAAGKHQDKQGQTECKQCSRGRFQPNVGKIECSKCPPGKYQGKEGQSECESCVAGRYRPSEGQDGCQQCPRGRFQPATGNGVCKPCDPGYKCAEGAEKADECPKGKYQPRSAQSDCLDCPAGKHQTASGQSHCQECHEGYKCAGGDEEARECPKGKYQPSSGKSRCLNCTAGHHQSASGQSNCRECRKGYKCPEGAEEAIECPEGKYQPSRNQSVCLGCAPGQYQSDSRQSKCQECDEGTIGRSQYQTEKGKTECLKCPWNSLCFDRHSEPIFNFLIPVIPILCLLALTPFFVQLAKLVIRGLTAWKPQSEADAARAKKFILPLTSPEMSPSVSAFKACEKHFIADGWSDEDLAIINEHRERVVKYLNKRVQEASYAGQIHIMQCCLDMDALHYFKTLYDATMDNISRKEPAGFGEYTAVAQEMRAECSIRCPRNPGGLIELYNSGRAVYKRFHAFIAEASKASHTAYVYKRDSTRLPRMKGIYRVLEKGIFKYNDDHSSQLDFGRVRDLVRGGIIDLTMKGLASIARYIFMSDKVTICRVKDRFNNPSEAGWTDLMVNFYFNDDSGKHVCEVQLIHFKMLSQRTTQEGHDAYNVFRSASELLVKMYYHGSVSKSILVTKKLSARDVSNTLKKRSSDHIVPLEGPDARSDSRVIIVHTDSEQKQETPPPLGMKYSLR